MAEKTEPAEKDDIYKIKGNTKILLIAPHGHSKDDKNTGKIVRALAEQNGCYAIINEYYRKPKKSNDDESADKKNKRVNLNRKGQVETHLKTEFLDPLIKYKNEIVERFGNVFLIWVHGAFDHSVPESIKVVVGYGQGKNDVRHTANIDTIDVLIKRLNENNLTAIKADIAENKFCARDINNMNQYFRKIEGKNLDTLQSIQLEFRWTGCRDTDESIETTAKNLAYAISAVVQTAAENNQSSDKAQVPEIISDPEEVKDAIEVGGTNYDPLVETAYQKLSQVFSTNYEQALMEAGQYIVRTFYGGEVGIEDESYNEELVFTDEVIERARKKSSSKEETLKQLYDKIDKCGTSRAPSRAWIYNAVNLIVQWHDLKGFLSENEFSMYRMLFLSHKVALLRIKDKDFLPIKQKLIEEEADNPSNVKDFIQKVQKALPPGTDEPPTLQSLLKKPDELIKEENAERFTIEELKSKQARTLENLKKITKEKHQNVQTEIDDLKKDLETRQKSLEKYVEVQGNIEEAIKFKEKKKPKKKTAQQTIKKASKTTAKEKKKVTGFQEWTKKENTVNICTGCANDCKYCYAKSMAYRFKRVPEGEWINQIIRDSDVNKKRKLYDGRVGFPTSHDITPDNLDAYLTVLKKLLESGNEVLIVSKPNLECIKKICEIGSNYKDKILFRFTIGAMNNDILRFWDTNAPLYEERKKSLKYAFDNGFQTSVSMEPLLDSANVITMATELEPYVTDAIWIGKMNHTGRLKTRAKNQDDQGLVEQVETIENGQTDDKIKAIFADFQKKPELLKKIKWKDSFKKILGIEEAAEAGMDV